MARTKSYYVDDQYADQFLDDWIIPDMVIKLGEMIASGVVATDRAYHEQLLVMSDALEDFGKTDFHGQDWCALYRDHMVPNSIGMKFSVIPQGVFRQGSPDWEKNANQDEKPQHCVLLPYPFAMCTTQVTQEQWVKVMGSNPSYHKGKDNMHYPVENITWVMANEFCEKLSNLPAEIAAGNRYFLPTESQWEYAARGGPGSNFFGYSPHMTDKPVWSITPKDANISSSDSRIQGIGHPTNVGSYNPNPLGLYDMTGNVWEWCQNYYDSEEYSKALEIAKKDPKGCKMYEKFYEATRDFGNFNAPGKPDDY